MLPKMEFECCLEIKFFYIQLEAYPKALTENSAENICIMLTQITQIHNYEFQRKRGLHQI